MKLTVFIPALAILIYAACVPRPSEADAVPREASSQGHASQPLPSGYRSPEPRPELGALGARSDAGSPRWSRPLAGLVAGGLLASLISGEVFQGFQVADLALIGLLMFAGAAALRKMRRQRLGSLSRASGRYVHSVAGYGAADALMGPEPLWGGLRVRSATPAPTVQLNSLAVDQDESPAWFDGPGFLEGARTHFIRLQAAWDQADCRGMRDYTTAQLFSDLKRERQRIDDARCMEVVRLGSELIATQRRGDLIVASVLFTGSIRDDDHGQEEDFQDLWHLQHAWNAPDGDWLVSQIQRAAV